MTEVEAGASLVIPTPNGARLCALAAEHGAVVMAGSLRNASAVAKWAQEHGESVVVIPAGERWESNSLRPALEDQIGAGAIVHHLLGSRSPEADAAAAIYEWAKDHLFHILAASASGKELLERGYGADVELAAMLNCSQVAPVMKNGVFVDAGVSRAMRQED
jgi:2-phosphosulfolactate phosphatase